MNPALMVIGVNHRSSPVEVRERFWVSESRHYLALDHLVHSPGIAEAVVLSTCNRTEFILWTSDSREASSSVVSFLGREYGLRLCEWKNFYRLAGDEALGHIFRVASSLDSMIVGEPEITGQVKAAWTKARQAGASGRVLDAVFQKALHVARRVRNETAIGSGAVSVPYAAAQLAKQIFGSLAERKVLIFGAGQMGELSVRYLMNHGASAVRVTNRTYEHAASLAGQLGGVPVPFEERWQHLAEADIVIGSTSCPHAIFTREDAERLQRQRAGRPLLLVDIAVPRDFDPAARQVEGVALYDIDDLQQVVARNLEERQAAAAEAEKLVGEEVFRFHRKLAEERVVPTLVALRDRLERIRRQELDRYRELNGSLASLEEEAIEALTANLVGRIASQLARELKGAAEEPEQARLAAAVQRLFQLRSSVWSAGACSRFALRKLASAESAGWSRS